MCEKNMKKGTLINTTWTPTLKAWPKSKGNAWPSKSTVTTYVQDALHCGTGPSTGDAKTGKRKLGSPCTKACAQTMQTPGRSLHPKDAAC